MNPFLKTATNFGVLSGLASFIIFLVLYYKGVNPLGRLSWLGAWIPVVFICIATKYYRDKITAGYLRYWSAFKIGINTGIFASLLFVLLVYIFGRVYEPGFVDAHKTEMLAAMEEMKMYFSEEFYEKGVEGIEQTTISELAYNDFFMKVLGAAIVSFITAAVYRKLPPEIEG